MNLLSMSEVAKRFGYSYHYFAGKIQHLKDFPKPVRLHPKARPKWTEESIDNYARNTQQSA